MKKFLLIFSFVTFVSCQEFLEEEMKTQVSTDDFYNNINDAERALNGAYSFLTQLYKATAIPFVSDMTADVLMLGEGGGGGSSIRVFDNFVFNASSADLLGIYDESYMMIGAVNMLLSRVGDRDLASSRQPVIIAEAKFLRALAYFYLVQLFGDVPLRTEPATGVTGLNNERDPAAVIYGQILTDLTDAVANMNEASLVKGRANKIAALTLLGKVHLTMGSYDEAIAALEQVIGKRKLYPNYQDVFKIANENNTTESIFEVQYGLRPYNNDIIQFLTPVQVTGVGSVYGVYQAEESLLNAYEPDDGRLAVTLWSEGNGKVFGGYYVRKFNDGLLPGVQATDAGQINFPVLRYADVLLMYAEALNAKNHGPTPAAYTAVEEVRNRAGLTDPLPVDLSEAAFLEVILKERLAEFASEGHRWFDLKRTGKLKEFLSTAGFVEGKHEVFPIPQAALDANTNLKQNAKY